MLKRWITLIFLILLINCDRGVSREGKVVKIGIPEKAVVLFSSDVEEVGKLFHLIKLKPEEKLESLQILLFSTKSSAFDFILLKGVQAFSLKRWAKIFPPYFEEKIRDDVLKIYRENDGIFALPITLDFPIFVYKKASFKDLYEPKTLGYLKYNLLELQEKVSSKPLIASSCDEEILFISLLASDRSLEPERIYDYHSIKLLEFFRDFELKKETIEKILTSFLKEEKVCAFVMLSEAEFLYNNLLKNGIEIEIRPLPSTMQSFALYNGYCLMGYNFSESSLKSIQFFKSNKFEKILMEKGYFPVSSSFSKRGNKFDAFEKVKFIGPSPSIETLHYLKEAINDVINSGDDVKQALIRAEARAKFKNE